MAETSASQRLTISLAYGKRWYENLPARMNCITIIASSIALNNQHYQAAKSATMVCVYCQDEEFR